MKTQRLDNYLRSYRKKSGLTQSEVGFLLGWDDGAQISRYEKRERRPPIETALACEAIFGVPMAELFAGIREAATDEVRKRLLTLRQRLQERAAKGSEALLTAHKLRWLDSLDQSSTTPSA